MNTIETDIVVVGGGVAGCIVSLLYARENLKVVLLERRGIDKYKINCTHYIQPIATKIINRLDLEEDIELAGGLKNKQNIWTPSGWINYDYAYEDEDEKPYGYNIKRQDLDPFLRRKILKEKNINLFLQSSMKSLLYNDNNEVSGVIARNNAKNEEIEIKAKLVVAAEGRASRIAKIIGNKPDKKPNHRFSCTAYFKNVPLSSGSTSQTWMITLGQAHAFHLSNNTTLLNVFIDQDVVEEWKNVENLEEKFIDFFSSLPDGPNLKNQERITDFYWMFNMTNEYYSPTKGGIAFIGDSALAVDPMSGAGCGFAMVSAELLVDSTAEALRNNKGLKGALENYSDNHIKALKSHADGIAAYSVSKKGEADSSFFDMVVKDKILSKHYLDLIGRLVTPKEFQTHFYQRMIDKQREIKVS